ncbi:MAG: class I SAM-dependent methyltransferase [Candidatus Dormibacteria bacterium]
MARRLLSRLRGGQLTVVEGAREERFGEPGDIDAQIVVSQPHMWRRALTGGGVGLAEAYMEGLWDSDDIVAVLRILARNLDRLNRLLRNPLTRLRSLGTSSSSHAPTGDEDRRNIHAHYDLGNDFFKLFLDPTMAYSCAVFERPEMTLQEAQTAKFDGIARRVGLNRDSRVLEIGTGWGGFAVHAARAYGAHVTTTTISEEQYAHATELAAREGLDDRVTVLREHYRDVRGSFSHVVSIEMIEAVDWRLYDEFFSIIAKRLRPDGVAAIQAITVPDREFDRSKRWRDFIKRYMFPGGCLPSVAAMIDSTKRVTDMSVIDLRDIGRDYVITLRHWRESLDSRLDAARSMGLSESFLRMWRYYFAYCEAGFAERRVSDVQLVFARPDWRPV